MTNPNLVSSNVIKGFSRTVNLSNADVLVLDNPTNSYNVIKINKISVATRRQILNGLRRQRIPAQRRHSDGHKYCIAVKKDFR